MQVSLWKDVIGYERIYSIDEYGVIKSKDRFEAFRGGLRKRAGRILKIKTDFGGYQVVHLRDKENNKESWISIHRLVAEAFIPNPQSKPTVNHKDGDKLNNHRDNLEWSSHKEQMVHAVNNKLLTVRGNTLYDKEFKNKVRDYFIENKISIKALGRFFNISERTAGRIAKLPYTTNSELISV